MNIESLKRLIDPLKRKIYLSICRIVVKLSDDGKKIQRLQVGLLKDETRDSVERFQEYGFTSRPHKGAEGIAVFPGGNRSHGVIIAVDDRRYRLVGLQEGEVALYTDEGDYIKFKRGRVIEVNTPKATFSGNVEIAGRLDVVDDIESEAEILDKDGSMTEMRTVYNSHTHPGDSGGTTGGPNQQMT